MIVINLQTKGVAKRFRNRQQRKRENDRAGSLRYRLIKLLGAWCHICGTTYFPILTIDHIDGATYDLSRVRYAARVYRYWKEYRADVRLQVLCGQCNSEKGRPEVPF